MFFKYGLNIFICENSPCLLWAKNLSFPIGEIGAMSAASDITYIHKCI